MNIGPAFAFWLPEGQVEAIFAVPETAKNALGVMGAWLDGDFEPEPWFRGQMNQWNQEWIDDPSQASAETAVDLNLALLTGGVTKFAGAAKTISPNSVRPPGSYGAAGQASSRAATRVGTVVKDVGPGVSRAIDDRLKPFVAEVHPDSRVLSSGSTLDPPVFASRRTQGVFRNSVEFDTSSLIDGTGFRYKVFQRSDIDWSMVRTTGARQGRGLTNAEAAARHGLAPILPDGEVATLHHSQQSAIGPLFEASTRYHHIGNAQRAPLHPFGRAQHPHNPLGRGAGSLREQFQRVDSPEYWKWRGQQEL